MRQYIHYSPLKSSQIRRILSHNTLVKSHFCGVYAADKLPSKDIAKGVYIVNTDTSSQPGSHWISIFLNESNEAFYFDSYGLPPLESHHVKFLNRARKWKYNRIRLQSDSSSVCGHYCCLFALFVSKAKLAGKFAESFQTKNVYENDGVVMLTFLNSFRNELKIVSLKDESAEERDVMHCVPRMRGVEHVTHA